MSQTVLGMIVAVLCLMATGAGRPEPERPPVFDARPYTEAKEAAARQKRWFIVKATAEWCGPCKQMDKTTWRDAKVEAWAKANAVVVQVDVDKEPAIAKELGIEAMPTMIAFKAGEKEFDRVVGYKAPEEFLDWLEGMQKGEKAIAAVERRVAGAKGKHEEVRARHDLARSLVQKRKYAEATVEYAWLWEHSADVPAYAGVRGSFMASDIENLTERHPPAKERFTEFRDELTPLLTGEKIDYRFADDWVVLNRVLGEEDRTLEWFDRVKGDAKWRPTLDRMSFRLEPMLIEHKRWADIGNMYRDPIAHLERQHEMLKMMPKMPVPEGIDEKMRRRLEDMPGERLRDGASKIYAGLLAARREGEAMKFAARARELETSEKMTIALVKTALQAEQGRTEHLEWLRGVEGEESRALSESVERQLRERAQ